MTEHKHRFLDALKDGLGYILQILSATIVPPMVNGAELVMQNIDDRMLLIERRILRKATSFCISGLGGLFLLFALFFALKEFLGWGDAAASFSIGIVVLIIGLLLKAGESGG